MDLGDNIPIKIGIGGTALNPIIKTDFKRDQGSKRCAEEVIEDVKDKVYEEVKETTWRTLKNKQIS